MVYDPYKSGEYSWAPYDGWKGGIKHWDWHRFDWRGPEQKMEVPDYHLYDSIEGIPELEHVRDTLASRGLKDPWIRNEVWRYPPTIPRNPMAWGQNYMFRYSFKYGFLIAVAVVSAQHFYYNQKYGGLPPYCYTLMDWMKSKPRYPPKI